MEKVATFFGIPTGDETIDRKEAEKWQQKRLRHLHQHYGLNEKAIEREIKRQSSSNDPANTSIDSGYESSNDSSTKFLTNIPSLC